MRLSSILATGVLSIVVSSPTAGAYCYASNPDSWGCQYERRMEQIDRESNRLIEDLQRQEDREKEDRFRAQLLRELRGSRESRKPCEEE